MKLVIASDHGGFRLKSELVELLRKAGREVQDLGPASNASCDYPDFAHLVANTVATTDDTLGILVCGTGVGMSIAANRHPGVRAVVCSESYSARLSRAHNDSNILCLGERVLGTGLAWEIVEAWLGECPSADERHAKRRSKIERAPR